MKRAYPTIKFVPPRSTSAGKKKAGSAASGDTAADGYTPPPRETATVVVSPALATAKKRKRPTTQSWKGPRRRLDPPSPSKAQKAGGSGPPQAKIDRYCTKLDDKPAVSTSSGACRRAALRTATAASHAEKPSRATSTSATGCCSTDALVMAAETPARSRNSGLPSVSRCSEAIAIADIDQRERISALRIPDTPDPPRVEERRAAQGGAKWKDVDSGSGSGSYSSSLSSPSVGLRDEDQGEEGKSPGVRGRAVRFAAAAAPASAPASASSANGLAASRSSGDSDDGSESESPDLLRSYTMDATVRSQDQGGGGGTGAGGTRSAEGVSRGEAASEESDTGSDSPDLLATYTRMDAGAMRGMGAAEKVLGSRFTRF